MRRILFPMVHLLGHQAWRHPAVQLCTVRVQLVAGLCASRLRGEGAECSVVLLSAPEMRRVCAVYHPSSHGATDVLSFPSGLPPQMDDLGDVYLEVWRRATSGRYGVFEEEYLAHKELGLPPQQWLDLHVDRVLIHAMCHLHGHTHDEEEDWASMLREERGLQRQVYEHLKELFLEDPDLATRWQAVVLH